MHLCWTLNFAIKSFNFIFDLKINIAIFLFSLFHHISKHSNIMAKLTNKE